MVVPEGVPQLAAIKYLRLANSQIEVTENLRCLDAMANPMSPHAAARLRAALPPRPRILLTYGKPSSLPPGRGRIRKLGKARKPAVSGGCGSLGGKTQLLHLACAHVHARDPNLQSRSHAPVGNPND